MLAKHMLELSVLTRAELSIDVVCHLGRQRSTTRQAGQDVSSSFPYNRTFRRQPRYRERRPPPTMKPTAALALCTLLLAALATTTCLADRCVGVRQQPPGPGGGGQLLALSLGQANQR